VTFVAAVIDRRAHRTASFPTIEAAIYRSRPCLLIAPLLEIGFGPIDEEDAPRNLERYARLVGWAAKFQQKHRDLMIPSI
jgi:hypothetical protein